MSMWDIFIEFHNILHIKRTIRSNPEWCVFVLILFQTCPILAKAESRFSLLSAFIIFSYVLIGLTQPSTK